MTDFEQIYLLGAALAMGLLVGVERGWQYRAEAEGQRTAGVRTFGLIGLLGGIVGLLGRETSLLLVGLGFAALAVLLGIAYTVRVRATGDRGVTGEIAALLVFGYGAATLNGHLTAAAAAAVVTTLLLSLKPILHRWLRSLTEEELRSALELLLISVVVLPVLPDRGYGPWGALNPYAIWWMVVLVSLISFAGYFAVRIGGERKGIAFTGLFAGLASSTALTLHFSRLARQERELVPVLSAGILFACGTMFPRMLAVAGIVNTPLVQALMAPAALMALVTYVPAWFYWRGQPPVEHGGGRSLRNPLNLRSALVFGLLLGLIMLLGYALQDRMGDGGVLMLAAASGIADVDAITLSLSRMSTQELTLKTAAGGVVIAAGVNSIVKGVMAAAIGGWRLGARVALPLFAAAMAGFLAVFLLR